MASPARTAGNLPADATSFVGRRRELADLRSKLGSARLITLVGPGGVGKTRLAVRTATNLGRRFRHGAWLAELADVHDPALVTSAVLAAFDLRDQAGTESVPLLISHLRNKDALLVIDNCEHHVAAVARLVADLIRVAPKLRVLATSREPLGIAGEHVFPVHPLELPSPDAEPLAQLRQNESVLLFTERAAAASGTFELTDGNRAAVVDLCRRLDGLPLAIELAAVRTRAMTVEQIRERLHDRFGLLTGGSRAALPRHQTLRTAIEWSHDLLEEPERMLLRRLSVFAGRFTLEDVGSVCASAGASAAAQLDVLSSLVDKSLAVKDDGVDVASFRMHETMREFAALKLREAGEVALIEGRFDEYYRSKCARSAAEARYRLVEWLAWLDLEIDNVRAVLQRCAARGDYGLGLGVATSIWWYWITRATPEGVRWLDTFLAPGDAQPPALGWPDFIRGFLAVLQTDATTARRSLRRAVAVARASGQTQLLSQSLSMVSIAEDWAGDRDAAQRLLDEARGVTDPADIPATLSLLQARALNGLVRGDLDSVRAAGSEGVRLSRDAGDLYALDMMLLNLALAALMSAEQDAARPHLHEGLRIAREIDDRVALFLWLDAHAYHASRSGLVKLAVQLLAAAQATRSGTGAGVNTVLAPLVARANETALTSLGAATFNKEFAAGSRLSREAAVRLALGEADEPSPASGDSHESVLGKRETDVARLVAEGLSNKQIGSRLFISERTVETHVRSVLNKLGFSSRAQIAGWISSSGRT